MLDDMNFGIDNNLQFNDNLFDFMKNEEFDLDKRYTIIINISDEGIFIKQKLSDVSRPSN